MAFSAFSSMRAGLAVKSGFAQTLRLWHIGGVRIGGIDWEEGCQMNSRRVIRTRLQ